VLGRFGGASLLGGEMPIDLNKARSVLSRLAEEISRFTKKPTTAQQAALGVIRVANANMEAALRVVSIERGQDPRLFALVSFGGAGGLHVCDLAASLRIPRVVVPKSPGTLSALGVLLGNVVKDYSRTVMMKTGELDAKALEQVFVELEQKATQELKAEGFDKGRLKLTRSVALRYAGQSFEIDIPWSKRFAASFHASHRERYGYADSSRPIEVVSLRVRAAGITQKPAIARERRTPARRVGASHVAPVYLSERQTQVPVYAREHLKAGMKFKGPAIVTEYSSTTLITANFRAIVDPRLNLIVEAI
jgi:N-methylhydantoinase A